jgi:hypothetical protein
MKFDIEHVEK